MPGGLTAAFNPAQPRDKNGRWISIGAFVHWSEGFAGRKKRSGQVVGVDPSGKYRVQTKDGEAVVSGDQVEVIDMQARLGQPPSAVQGLDMVTQGLIQNTGQALGQPLPSVPVPVPAPTPIPVPRTPSGSQPVSRLTAGDRFQAFGPQGEPWTLTVVGNDGSVLTATDQHGNRHDFPVDPTARVNVVTASVSVLQRLDALEAALPGLTAAKLISADYYHGGGKDKDKGGGRKVASKAGEKRYGLPIGTPLGQGKSGGKTYDRKTEWSYNRAMAGKTPAEIRENLGRMGNVELARAAKALFSFDSKNERDQAARMALVRELADRGVDPKKYGYKGAVVLNPRPKKDPVAGVKEDKEKERLRRKKEQDVAQNRLAESDAWFKKTMARPSLMNA